MKTDIGFRCLVCQASVDIAFIPQDAESFTCPSCGRLVDLSGPPADEESSASISMVPTTLLRGPVSLADLPTTEVDDSWIAAGRIGRFRIVRLLGQGSFGRVYLANDESLKRQVAVKVPRPDRLMGSDRDEFVAEAELAAALRHPGVVTIYDVGPDDRFGCFIAMEYIEGQSLQSLLRARSVPVAEACRITAEIAAAVHAAHRAGLVHRDLKPANVLIETSGRVVVTDFGIALNEETQAERSGEVAGTLTYMAPELARGESHFVDGRADVWSIGIILYRMLAGRVPWQGQFDSVVEQILHREPKPLRQIDDTIPPQLEAICLKCLAKSPSDRYLTAADLAEAIRAALAESTSPPDSTIATAVPSPPPSSRHWLGWLVGGLACLAGLAGAAQLAGLGGPAANLAGLATPAAHVIDQEPPVMEPPLAAHTPRVHQPRRWYRLFDRPPQNVWFPDHELASHWHFDQPTETLVVNNQQYAIFLAHTTSSPAYRVQVSVSRNAYERGLSGLILGYRDMADSPDRIDAAFQTIALKCVDSQKFMIERAAVRMRRAGDGWATFSVDRFDAVDVEALNFRERLLEVRVRDGQVNEILWDGQRLDELLEHDPNVRLPFEPAATGGIGVINGHEDATFRDLRFMTEILE